MMNKELKSLLCHDLMCSKAFVKVASRQKIKSISELLAATLGPETGGKPDICDLLFRFHRNGKQELDLDNNFHPFKFELIALFCFGLVLQEPWNSLKPGETFNFEEHWSPLVTKMLHAKLVKHASSINFVFKHGLAQFVAEIIASQDFEQPKGSTVSASPRKMAKLAGKILGRSHDVRMETYFSDIKLVFSHLLRSVVCPAKPSNAS